MGSGGKRPLNGTSKVNRQTHRWTDRRIDRQTFGLIESIGPEGPEGRCFENVFFDLHQEKVLCYTQFEMYYSEKTHG